MEKVGYLQMTRRIMKYVKLTFALVLCLFLCACWPKTENYFLDSGKLQVNGVIYVPYPNMNNESGWALAGPYEEIGRFDRTNWAAYKYKYAEQADAIEARKLRGITVMAYLYIREGLEVPEPIFEHIGEVKIYSRETDEILFLTKENDSQFIIELMSNSDIKKSSNELEYREIAFITFFCDSIDGACFFRRLMKSTNGEEYYFSDYKGIDVLIPTELGQRIESMFNNYEDD